MRRPGDPGDRRLRHLANQPELPAWSGPIADTEERERLETLARQLVYKHLTIVGAVDDAALNEELERADIICCLRRPVLEGASGSAIEGLLSGRPTVVADAGFYSSLPDGVVAKVPGDLPAEAIRSTLERLAADEPGRRRLGETARAWAQGAFHLDRYLDVLERLMPATQAMVPLLATWCDLGRGAGAARVFAPTTRPSRGSAP